MPKTKEAPKLADEAEDTSARDTAADSAPDDLPPPPELVEIPFKGHVFTVPKDRDIWSLDSELALYEARATNLSKYWVQWVELGLGPSQWLKLLDVMDNRGDLVAFTKVFMETVFSECVG